MGNAAWGNGYHKGFGEGKIQGGVIGAAVTLAAAAAVAAAKWGIGKYATKKAAESTAAADEQN